MTRRRSNSLLSGRAHHLHDRKRRGRSAVPPSACSSSFSTFAALCIKNSQFYCKVLTRLREDIRRKRPDLRRAKNWMVHDDNAPCHRSLLTREFLAKHNMIALLHPPYSLDLAPADFALFPRLKIQLKGRSFDTLRRSSAKRRRCLTPFGKWTSRTHSRSGKNAV